MMKAARAGKWGYRAIPAWGGRFWSLLGRHPGAAEILWVRRRFRGASRVRQSRRVGDCFRQVAGVFLAIIW